MIYIHVPFCGSFCRYCDFYSEIPRPGDVERYVSALCREARAREAEIRLTSQTDTLYIGGGTPSVLPPGLLEKMVDGVGGGPWREFTVEVNPDDIVSKGVEYARGLKSLGVNRVSMGVQSLDDGILKWMRRRHDAAGARRAFGILREAGFENVSVDVIYGISGMPESVLEKTLDEIVSWAPEHVSAYQLTLEGQSELCRLAREGRYRELSDEECAANYRLVCSKLGGYFHYEISSWAANPSLRAVHNSAYWRRAPYVGLGPGAHSLGYSSPQAAEPDRRSWNSQETAPRENLPWPWTSGGETLSPREIEEEKLLLGLRTVEGYGGRRLSEEEWFVSDLIASEMDM